MRSVTRLRTGKRGKVNRRPIAADADAIRRRRATANRVLTALKAALNFAWKEGRIASDAGWRPVKPFRNVDAPVVLTEEGQEFFDAVAAGRDGGAVMFPRPDGIA